MTVSLPYKFEPRDYQIGVLKSIDNGCRRAVCVWHRRAGKDKTLWNLIIKKTHERVGNYYYYFPTMSQGRKTIWQGIDKAGKPFLDHVPRELIANQSKQEMRIDFSCGSAVQVVGTDRLEVVGPNPVGCVFSEYSLQDPSGWNYIRPILVENEGWAVFNYTPRGMNHGYELYQMAVDNPDWFAELLTVDDTGAISKEAIDAERNAGMSDGLIRQEFYCSFEYGLEGAYYRNQMSKVHEENRVCGVPAEDVETHTAWDLGIGDYMSIWFVQLIGKEVRLIDYYENVGEGLAHYAQLLKEKLYTYGTHLAPHDIQVRELGTGQSRIERGEELGIKFETVQKLPVDDGVQAVRSLLGKCWFDEKKTKGGRHALMNYQKEWNEKQHCFSDRPLHNWASHGSDALRTLAVGFNRICDVSLIDIPKERPRRPSQTGHGWMIG